MSLPWDGYGGLKWRLRQALVEFQTYPMLAEFLDVPVAEVQRGLEDDSYTPPDDVLATMYANLGNIVPEVPAGARLEFSENRSVFTYTSPLWDSAQMEAIDLPAGALSFRWVYMGGSGTKGISTSEAYDPETFGIEEGAQDTVGDDYEKLLSLRVYVANV